MRKRILGASESRFREESPWLDLEQIAEVEVTSEDPDHSIERALSLDSTSGWRASEPGEQIIRLIFDEPQEIGSVRLVFVEDQVERSQEFSLLWSEDEVREPREILRQQFNFSPAGCSQEREQFAMELHGAKVLELRIVPHTGGGAARASLDELRVA